MKIFYIILVVCCILYFAIAGITAYKLAKNQIGVGVLHRDQLSEVIKESGVYDIYNINGRNLND